MIKIENKASPEQSGEPEDTIVMTYDQRKKGRIRVTSQKGQEYGLFLERGKVLIDGELLVSENGGLIQVKAELEALTEGVCSDWETFSKCCYHLGNRHVPVDIGDKRLRIQSDHILKDMLTQLGMEVRECQAPFMPEQGAYSGGHHHHHDH